MERWRFINVKDVPFSLRKMLVYEWESCWVRKEKKEVYYC